ncbi:MAG TPA: 2-phospho-L-lactate guanylyltransferase [Methylomirabilota bacterium]|nr:2-phospho-L-lactate guanylyltransferase [Methylomirabilota bacterium]
MSPVARPRLVYAVIPVGRLDGAKSRLGEVLDAEERHDLVLGLADATIRAAVAAPGITETLVVTPDDTVRDLALAAGARPIRQRSRGLNAGLREARAEALAAGATAMLILPIDLPGVTPAALAAVLDTLDGDPGPLVALVPDRHGRGTNALLLDPPDVIDVHFGGDSRAAHVAAARAAGARAVELDGPLSQDLDTPDDLLASQAATGPPHGG